MEQEASQWGLEPRDVQSLDELGPEGSLKGEGGSAPPRSVSGIGRWGGGPWERKRAGDLDTGTWRGWVQEPSLRCAEGKVGISAPAQGPATMFEEEGEVCGN